MDISAFGVKPFVIFLLFIIPGLIFRRFYYQGEFTKQFRFKTIGTAIFSSLIIGIIVQIISIHLYKYYFETELKTILPKSDILLEHISDIYNSMQKIDFNSIFSHTKLSVQIGLYLVFSYINSIVLAFFLWLIVRTLKLDRKFKIFRFNNHWNYYFLGEIGDFREFKHLKRGKVLYTEADIVIQTTSGNTIMYSGKLSQYTISENSNDLKNIYLTDARRQFITKCPETKKEKKEHRSFNSDCLILNNKDILNINLNYICKYNPSQHHYIPIVFIVILICIIISNHELLYSDNIFFLILKKVNSIIIMTWFLSLVTHFIKDIDQVLANKILINISKKDGSVKDLTEKMFKNTEWNFVASSFFLIVLQFAAHIILNKFL